MYLSDYFKAILLDLDVSFFLTCCKEWKNVWIESQLLILPVFSSDLFPNNCLSSSITSGYKSSLSLSSLSPSNSESSALNGYKSLWLSDSNSKVFIFPKNSWKLVKYKKIMKKGGISFVRLKCLKLCHQPFKWTRQFLHVIKWHS